MKFWEAMKALAEGKKVRRKDAVAGQYYTWTHGMFTNHNHANCSIANPEQPAHRFMFNNLDKDSSEAWEELDDRVFFSSLNKGDKFSMCPGGELYMAVDDFDHKPKRRCVHLGIHVTYDISPESKVYPIRN